MEEILDFVNKNPWLNVIFILLTLTSIFFSIWFYIKSIKSKRPTYALRSFNLIKEKINTIDSVEVKYQNNKIDNLSVTKLAIWNNGKETISASDVAQNNPFLITIEQDFQILDCNIIFEKNSANGFILTQRDSNSIEIKFDYFDFNEGIIVQLYHTATENERISVVGSFKGTRKIERNSLSRSIFPMTFYKILNSSLIKPRLIKRVIGLVTLLFPLVVMILIIFMPENRPKTEPTLAQKFLFVSLTAIPYWWLSYKTLKRRVPRGFGIFEDEF